MDGRLYFIPKALWLKILCLVESVNIDLSRTPRLSNRNGNKIGTSTNLSPLLNLSPLPVFLSLMNSHVK
jgi:hypothetical protein